MPIIRQGFDLILAIIFAIGFATTLTLVGLDTSSAEMLGVILGTVYYFSRYPWGRPGGEKYNETIDELYERYFGL